MSRRTRLLVLLVTAAMALAAVAYAWITHNARSPQVDAAGNHVRLQGPIVDESVNAVIALLDADPTTIKTLVVRSQGGDMRAAIRLGTQLFERGVDVEVDGYCLSSCASYLFTAGRHKRMRAGSVVAWHGSAIQPDFLDGSWEAGWRKAQQCENPAPAASADCETRLGKLRDYLAQARTEQQAFFQRIGVDEQLTVYGQTVQPCQCSWTFAVDDMAHFGIGNVQSDDLYFSSLGYWAGLAQRENQVRLLKLADATEATR